MASSLHHQPIPSRHVVAVPYPGRGHINPMLSLCTALAERSSDMLITVILTEEWLGLLAALKKPPNMSFAAIPNVVPSEKVRGDDPMAFFTAVLTKMEAPFERLLDGGELPPSDFIIGDALMSWVYAVAGRRNIPSAHLWTMSASVYTVFYHFDLLVQNGHYPVDLSVNGEAIVDYIPGLSPSRLADLPLIVKDQESFEKSIKTLPNDSNAKHLIFNSFYELESQVFDALKHKSSMSIYNIGPATTYFKLRAMKTNPTTTTTDYYLRWLELQPPSSVLYVSLGSFLHISAAQMDEIAAGLHGSGVRFLWVAKRGMSRLQQMVGDKGLVVEWCDQMRVLAHSSVGGFLSHCGWNSTKETVLASVPVLAFPIIVDQLPNTKVIVDDWRVGWRMLEREFNEEDLIKSDRICEIVKRFMDLGSVERKEISRNAREIMKICEREFADGGSFHANLDAFVKSIMQLN
ncbi:hypothetical protein C2S51_016665 [Perilla frutescens var. frutescens]|nr:hypothetical protein C2S51_016665 [Perilla frutescens var. frutescens]